MDIPIIPPASLPKPSLVFPGFKFLEYTCIEFTPSFDNTLRQIPFDYPCDLGHWVLGQSRPNQQMHMLRHHYPCQQMKSCLLACELDLIDKGIFDPVISKER